MEETTLKKLMTSTRCSSCGQHYVVDNIEVIGHCDEIWFMSVLCPTCHAQYLVMVVFDEEATEEIITDLSSAELEKFRDADGLKVDEVLEMHSFLKEFGGDFLRLFNEEKT